MWIHLAETLAHGWDLATATGQDPGFEDDLVEASLAECRARMPEVRGDGTPFADATGEGVAAAPIDRLAAFLGRDTGTRTAG